MSQSLPQKTMYAISEIPLKAVLYFATAAVILAILVGYSNSHPGLCNTDISHNAPGNWLLTPLLCYKG